jgi:hypothetical protein
MVTVMAREEVSDPSVAVKVTSYVFLLSASTGFSKSGAALKVRAFVFDRVNLERSVPPVIVTAPAAAIVATLVPPSTRLCAAVVVNAGEPTSVTVISIVNETASFVPSETVTIIV